MFSDSETPLVRLADVAQPRFIALSSEMLDISSRPKRLEISNTSFAKTLGAESAKQEKTEEIEKIAQGFDEWLTQLRRRGNSEDFIAGKTALRKDYLSIARKALDANGYEQPREFLRSLSPKELQVLQHLHHGMNTDPIKPAALTNEGALNLLLPPSQSRDLDQNGITEVGQARTLVFPPHDAPQEFVDAWARTTENLDEGTVLTMELKMHILTYGIGDRQSGSDPKNVARDMSQYDYHDLVKRAIDDQKFQLTVQRTALERAFSEKLLNAFKLLYTEMQTSAQA